MPDLLTLEPRRTMGPEHVEPVYANMNVSALNNRLLLRQGLGANSGVYYKYLQSHTLEAMVQNDG